jgi:WXG100 family type VII secretion target
MELDGMGALVEKLRSAVQSIETELSTLDAEAVRLRSSWSGEAAAAYDRAHADWTRSLVALHAALDRAATGAQSAVDRHLAARAEVAALSKRVPTSTPTRPRDPGNCSRRRGPCRPT